MKTKRTLRVLPFALCAASLLVGPPTASAQSAAGAGACAPLAKQLAPQRLAAPALKRGHVQRRIAHLREYVGCLKAHGVQPAPRSMADRGTYVTFDVAGSIQTVATAINNARTIAGWYVDTSSNTHSFVRARDGASTPFDPSGSTWISQVTAIDARGTVAGFFGDATGDHAFLRYPWGNFAIFDAPGATFTAAVAMNAAGDVGGVAFDSTSQSGFLRSPSGASVAFNAPPPGDIVPGLLLDFSGGSLGFTPFGLNESGTIVASSFDHAGQHGYGLVRGRDGAIATFEAPGSKWTLPSDINASGWITGLYIDASDVFHGFLRARGGAIATFDPPNSALTVACCINNAGAIAGWYLDANFIAHGYARARNGAFIAIDPPDSIYTEVNAINDRGEAVGFYIDGEFIGHGFLWKAP